MSDESKGRVLIIDDEPDILVIIDEFLRLSGYDVHAFSRPEDALQSIEKQGEQPDVILTDVRMPEMTGVEFLERINESFPGLPVILMSGYTDFQTLMTAVKRRPFDFIPKPIAFGDLKEGLDKGIRYSRLLRLEERYKRELEETVREKTRELEERMEELERARQAAMESSRLKSEFLSNINHEIRTPVNGIMGMIDLALDEESVEDRREYLLTARDSAMRLIGTVKDIIDLSLLVTEQQASEKASLSLEGFIADLYCALGRHFTGRPVEFRLTIETGIPSVIGTDKGKLERIIGILVENAAKFTEKGSVTLGVAPGREGGACISVSDTGIGISRDHLPTIFDHFTQGDGSHTRKYGGTGVGLSIVALLAHIIGGKVSVESDEAKGSVFKIELPASPEE